MTTDELIARLSDVGYHGLREVDADIFNAFPDEHHPREAYREENCIRLNEIGRSPRYHDGWLTRRAGAKNDTYPEDLPRLTSSLDAAMKFVERILPRWRKFLTDEDYMQPREQLWRVRLSSPEKTAGGKWPKHVIEGFGASAPTALLSAALRASQLTLSPQAVDVENTDRG